MFRCHRKDRLLATSTCLTGAAAWVVAAALEAKLFSQRSWSEKDLRVNNHLIYSGSLN